MKESKNSGVQIRILDTFSEQDNTLLERVYRYSPEIKRSLSVLMTALDASLGSAYSIFLSGSYAFSSRSGVFANIKASSDVDIWIVVSDDVLDKNTKLNQFSETLLGLNNFDMVMHEWDDDKRFSVKFVNKKILESIFTESKPCLTVKRFKSLFEKKQENTFYGINGEKLFPVKESFLNKEYVWTWELLFSSQKDKFILSDLISFFIVGFFVKDDLFVSMLRRNFVSKVDDILYGLNNEEFINLFAYFSTSLPSSFAGILNQPRNN